MELIMLQLLIRNVLIGKSVAHTTDCIVPKAYATSLKNREVLRMERKDHHYEKLNKQCKNVGMEKI